MMITMMILAHSLSVDGLRAVRPGKYSLLLYVVQADPGEVGEAL